MTSRTCLLPVVTALFATVAAFSPSTGGIRSTLRLRARSAAATDGPNYASRRDAVSTALSGAAALSSLLVPVPAVAGVGAEAPFETARAQYYPGALKNSVVSLRITSALRWINTSATRRRANVAYINPKRTIVGGLTCPDDATSLEDSLAGVIGKEYAGAMALKSGPGGAPVDLKADLKALAAKLPDDANKANGARGNVVLTFGPHVGISKEGRLGYIEYERDQPLAVSEYVAASASTSSNDEAKAIIATTKQAYKSIRDKVEGEVVAAGEEIWDGGIAELTLVGGITINRAKFGKDKGEDWFYPLSAKTFLADGTTIDKFEGAFGDMGIPDKDRT